MPSRLGRLPFMDPKLRKGYKAQLLKRCSMRVKCFVETDAGFLPTCSKTDLAHQDPFTIALKNLGDKVHGKNSEAVVEIFKDGKQVSILQLEREYQEWTLQMHDQYDEEIDSGEDEAVLVVHPSNKRRLGISSDVVRVHQVIWRKGSTFRAGTKLKILKGAVGFLKNNLYAILEYILLEGFQGDVGGDARLICRPLGCSEERGCLLLISDGTASLDIRDSISLPISVIDSGQCQVVDMETWNFQLGRKQEKVPSRVDILSREQCHLLEIDGELPVDAPIYAGCIPPKDIAAVIRPATFSLSSSSTGLDQKYIIKDELEMCLKVTSSHDENSHGNFVPAFMERTKPSLHKGFFGLYIFPLGRKYPNLFCRAGVYTFHLSVMPKDATPLFRELKVTVRPSSTVDKWTLSTRVGHITDKSPLIARVGCPISYLSISAFDIYSNQLPFPSVSFIKVKISANDRTLVNVEQMKVALSSDRKLVEIMDMVIESCLVDMIRPHYEALLEVCLMSEPFSQSVPCKVFPGSLHSIALLSSSGFEKSLIPGNVIEELRFEACDAYGNHVEEGIEVHADIVGLRFLDHVHPIFKVDNEGYIDLSRLLKVVASYGSTICLSIYYGSKMLFEEKLQVEKRELMVLSGVPVSCAAGSFLEEVVFHILNPMGEVDETIDGQYHTLVITSDSMSLDNTIQYTFLRGKCIVRHIPVPREKGTFRFTASHTQHREISTSIEVCVVESPTLELIEAEEPYINIFQSQLSDVVTLHHDSSHNHPISLDILVDYVMHFARKLDEDVSEAAELVGREEHKLKALQNQKASIGQDLDDLQAGIDPNILCQVGCLYNTKERVVKHIEAKVGTAASVFCCLLENIQFQERQESFIEDFIGIVALLGTVDNDMLSRVLAEYLTESYMLAVVFGSYQAAISLEKYAADGTIDRNYALHKIASQLGTMINKRFTVICLNELRPYCELEESSYERKLVLPNPCLPSGEEPEGFIGYAVNMINVDNHCLDTRISSAYGLRETLFYHLFGELQVYQKREDVERAKACIKCGAVSLDGGIMRENRVMLLGNCVPDVMFPVRHPVSEHAMKVKQVEKKKCEMARLDRDIAKQDAARGKAVDEFRKKSEQLIRFMPDNKLGLLEYKSSS